MTSQSFAKRRRDVRLAWVLVPALVALALHAYAQAPVTTVVSSVVYRADGTPASGTVVLSWPAFNTADDRAIAAGSMTLAIGPGGVLTVALAPTADATPSGTFYRVVLKLDDGSTSEEFWNVPAVPSTTIAAVRSKIVSAGVAIQVASRQYVDTKLALKADEDDVVHLAGSETIAGTKTFSASPVVPAPTTDSAAATKAYVDAAAAAGVANTVSLNPSGSQTVTQPAGTALIVTGGNALLAQKLNHVRYADQFPGATLGEKIMAAFNDLPSWGGTIYAGGSTSNHSLGTLTFTGKHITLILHGGTYDFTGIVVNTHPVTIIGQNGSTLLNYTPLTGDGITMNYDAGANGALFMAAGLRNLTLQGPGAGTATAGLVLSAAGGRYENLRIINFGVGTRQDDGFLNHFEHVIWSGNGKNWHTPATAGAGASENTYFSNCVFHDNAAYVANSVHIEGTTDLVFDTTSFDNAGIQASAPGGIVRLVFHGTRHENPAVNTTSPFVSLGSNVTAKFVNPYFLQGQTSGSAPARFLDVTNNAIVSLIGVRARSGLAMANFAQLYDTATVYEFGSVEFQAGVTTPLAKQSGYSGRLVSFGNAKADTNELSHDGLFMHFNVSAAATHGISLRRSDLTRRWNLTQHGAADGYKLRLSGFDGTNSPNIFDARFSGATGAFDVLAPMTGQRADFVQLAAAVSTVSFSTTPAFNAALGNTQKMTLTGNVTSATLSNAVAGQQLHFLICQDATGGRTFTWPTNVKGAMCVGAKPGSCSAQSFIYDGTTAYALTPGVINQ
jgi:hypothetical protein